MELGDVLLLSSLLKDVASRPVGHISKESLVTLFNERILTIFSLFTEFISNKSLTDKDREIRETVMATNATLNNFVNHFLREIQQEEPSGTVCSDCNEVHSRRSSLLDESDDESRKGSDIGSQD